MSHSIFARPLSFPTKLGIAILSIIVIVSSILLYRMNLNRSSLPPFSSQVASPSPDPTLNWVIYSFAGIELKRPPEWDELVGKCQSLTITKSDAIDLEQSLSEYVISKYFSGDSGAYESSLKHIVETTGNYGDLSLNLPHISGSDLVILGPLGEGELNNVVLRGPEGTGYFNIVVNYSGPIPDKKKVCLGDMQYEYKKVLSTIKFSSSGARLNEPCAGPHNISCSSGLVCHLENPSQLSQGGICLSDSLSP